MRKEWKLINHTEHEWIFNFVTFTFGNEFILMPLISTLTIKTISLKIQRNIYVNTNKDLPRLKRVIKIVCVS